MKQRFLILAAMVVTIVGCTSSQSDVQPEAVVNSAIEAWNAGDVATLKDLFADDAIVYFPDWGDTESGAEEIGAWIDSLVAEDFVIEPEITEVEGSTVTVVAKVWANPTRELGIAPLVTTDVYTIQDGKIASQTSTLSEESSASLLAAMTPAIGTVEDLVGAWEAGHWVLEFTERGGYRVRPTSSSVAMVAGEFWFEEGELHLRDRTGGCSQNEVGRYEIQGAPGDSFTLIAISEPCDTRGVVFIRQWTWVSN